MGSLSYMELNQITKGDITLTVVDEPTPHCQHPNVERHWNAMGTACRCVCLDCGAVWIEGDHPNACCKANIHIHMIDGSSPRCQHPNVERHWNVMGTACRCICRDCGAVWVEGDHPNAT